jgi:hypothetical protein
MVDEENIPRLDRWTKRASDDVWILGEEIEHSAPIDREFMVLYEDNSDDLQSHTEQEYHAWTDGSRQKSQAFG